MPSATCMQVPTTTTTSAGVQLGAADPCVASAGIVGGSGYTGALLAELLLRHPSVKLAAISSETFAGQSVQEHLPRLRSDLAFCSQADLGGVDVAFLCTPHGDTAPIARKLLDDGVKVIDLSADFRLDAATYDEWYGEHPYPEMLPGVYGLTELHRDEVAGADLVANPGCYPTAALLALAPLGQLGLADVIIDAKSGVSGAGKTPKPATHFCSVDSDLVAYGVGSHRHYPEIAAGLAAVTAKDGLRLGAAAASGVGSSPGRLPVPHLRPAPGPAAAGHQRDHLRQAGHVAAADPAATSWRSTSEFYAGETFVEVCAAPPALKDVAGTNYCRIFPHVDARAGRIVVISVIDNLMKGASGQAVQNMNVMLGLPEHEGLV